MSSVPDPISAGTTLQHYRLVQRLSGATQTWIAEDTRNGNKVAVKILSRIIPKDKATRDSALKQIRLKAAIGHPGIANVMLIDVDNDVLWMASEFVQGESLTRVAQRTQADKQTFLRYAWQMADTLSAVHGAGMVMGHITGESWIITPDDDVKLVGFRIGSFMGKHETGQTLLSGIKATQLREAAYLSPEQVTGKLVTSKTDTFALGVCLYELMAGALPFQGASVADVAHSVSTASPPAPKNPEIDRSFLAPVGKCIQKSPESRYEKVAFLKEDLAKLDPDVASIARRRGVTSPGGIPLPKREASGAAATETFIMVGELPYHELLRRKDPDRASRLENTMQQFLGEAVYLFDGTVLDSLGPVMIASLPDGASAVKAAQKGLSDLVEHNMTHGEEPVEPRLLVHFGELIPTAGKPEGKGLATARSVLEAMEPLQLLVSRPVIERVDVAGEAVPIGRLADIDFYRAPDIREPEPEPVAPPTVVPAATPLPPNVARVPAAKPAAPGPARPKAPTAVSAAPVTQLKAAAAPASEKRSPSVIILGIAAVVVLMVGAIVAIFTLRGATSKEEPPPPVATSPPLPPVEAVPAKPEVQINPDRIFFAAFEVESPAGSGVGAGADATTPGDPETTSAASVPEEDSTLRLMANDLRSAIDRIVALDPSLERVVAPSEDSRTLGGRLSRGAEGIVLTPYVVATDSETPAAPIVIASADQGALAYVRKMWRVLQRDSSFIPNDDVQVGQYLLARSLRQAGDAPGALTTITAVNQAENDFLPGVRMQMELLMDLDRTDEAIDAAKHVAALDHDDIEIRRKLADWEFGRGNPGSGLVWLGELLHAEPDNVEMLTRIGQYALAVGNEEKFNAVMARLGSLSVENPRLSAGDIMLAHGRLEAAAKKFYADQNTQPDNPVLSLKIGRLAVLRRSDAVLQAELERLQRLDAPFELAVLQAYIDANSGNANGTDLELKRAAELATPLDTIYTASAECYLLLNRQDQVLESLEMAVGRAEPTHEYILSNPIFGYLSNDPRFRSVLQTIGEQRARISSGLDAIML